MFFIIYKTMITLFNKVVFSKGTLMSGFKIIGMALKLLPKAVQLNVVVKLVSRPMRIPSAGSELSRLAESRNYGANGNKVAWYIGTGPLIVCVHGWGGAGAEDMGKLAIALSKLGFTIAVLDLSGHGASPGKSIGFGVFIRDICEFSESLDQPIYAVVGFSAGGLSLMAARYLGKIYAKKYICIASPCKPYPPLKEAVKSLDLSEELTAKYQEYLASEFGVPWDDITKRCFASCDDQQLCLIYDNTDTFVKPADADEIASIWKRALVVKTNGNKHRLMPVADEVIQAVAEFIVGNR